MKKLIMAVLACFSVTAYADIYVCESEISEEIVAPNVLTGSYINTEVTKYSISMGMKVEGIKINTTGEKPSGLKDTSIFILQSIL